MPATISNSYIQTFERIVRQLAQQSETKLRTHVTERGEQSQKHNWDRLGKGTAVQKTGTLVDTPNQELPWSRRVSVAQTWHAGESVEQEDVVQMLIDPNSAVSLNLGMSMKRAVDDIIIAAATGTALDGSGGSNTFPSGQVVGNGTAPISFDMVTEVQERFMQNDIDPSEPKCFVVGPTQVRKLMQLTEQTSADYVNAQALQKLNASGIVPNWMGFTWVMSTRLLEPAAGQLACLAFTKRALGLHIAKDITARVAEDPSKSFAWRLYCHMTMGAVRVEDEHIVEALVKDSLT
jgi:hypothetical protein